MPVATSTRSTRRARRPNFSLDLRYVNATPVTVSTPVLFASIARSGSTADLYALVEGAESISVTVQVRTGASCTNGVLNSPTLAATTSKATDEDGYVLFDGVPGISSGQFVTITVTSPASAITPVPSECIRTTGDNAAWPKALPLTFNSPATVQDVLEVDGRARWYRFPISPNQRITVSLSGLSADYELAVFRDIGAEFASQLVPTTADGLKRLSAKFSPSVFSPSVFSPSVFSPSVFSPDAYSPSVFSPSVFSPIGLQSIGLQPVGLQPERVLAVGLQSVGLQSVGLQPERVLAIGLQPVGLQPERVQRRGYREGVLERAVGQHHRRLGNARQRRRDGRREQLE